MLTCTTTKTYPNKLFILHVDTTIYRFMSCIPITSLLFSNTQVAIPIFTTVHANAEAGICIRSGICGQYKVSSLLLFMDIQGDDKL